YLITDEMYEDFVYDGKKHISIGSFPQVADQTISVFGFSKSHAMTGWRIGYVVAKQNLIDEIFKIHDSIITCPTAAAQYAALAAVEGTKEHVKFYKEEFLKRRKIVLDELAKTDKIEVITPSGAYYAFPKILADIDDNKLVMDLIENARVAVIPGSAFGKGGENHIRISFGQEEKILREGLKRFVNYLNKI
ncbi:MAG: aminotransferase class I/II-fold pyridoxal phosphate-dependent enzyme, partial [Candidatus Levybacteria bacterium]|nr:aminotransferase class I/II-fold pyridoxal phosphate-dependent enzyme [Candidatus Levybacteria bacterium]